MSKRNSNNRDRSGQIIFPTNAKVDDIAAREVAEQQAVESHPVFKLIQGLRKEVLHELARLSEQNRQITGRMHALFDYLNSIGLLVVNGFDPQTGKAQRNRPTDFEDGVTPLISFSKMPTLGFDTFIEEHMELSYMIIHLNMLLRAQNTPMKDIIRMAREFNNAPERLRKITGDTIPLVEYMNTNPDKLIEEELDLLAIEFKLKKEEDEHGVGEVHTTSPVTEVPEA